MRPTSLVLSVPAGQTCKNWQDTRKQQGAASLHSGEDSPLNGQCVATHAEDLHQHRRGRPQCVKGLNVRPKTKKPLLEKSGNLPDLRLGSDFLVMMWKTQTTKVNIENMRLHQSDNLSLAQLPPLGQPGLSGMGTTGKQGPATAVVPGTPWPPLLGSSVSPEVRSGSRSGSRGYTGPDRVVGAPRSVHIAPHWLLVCASCSGGFWGLRVPGSEILGSEIF